MSEKKMQKLEWIPTERQRKQLEVMLDPDNWGKSKSELIKLSGISRPGYYKNLECVEFRRYFNSCFKETMTFWKPEVFSKILENANNSFQDRKLLAEIVGLISSEQAVNASQTNVNVSVNNNIPDLKTLSDKDLEKLAQQYEISEAIDVEIEEE